jgi:hypothetical protein
MLLLVIGVGVGSSFLVSYIGGWRALAALYRRPEGHLQPEFSRFRSARFTWVRYRGCVTLGAGGLGLDISVSVPWPGHPPLRIPWSDISARLEGGWYLPLRLTFPRVPGVRVRLPANCIEPLSVASGGRLRIEGAA